MSRNPVQRRIATGTTVTTAKKALMTLLAIIVAALGAAGCVRVRTDDAERVTARQVDLGVFAREDEPSPVEATADETPDAIAGDDPPEIVADGWRFGAASPGVGSGVALPPNDEGAVGTQAPVLVDAMVGQVNGRPIFADDFFEPIEDRLIAESSRSSTEREYTDRAAPIIMNELRLVVINALFLAEAQAGLSMQEEQGIRVWLATLQEEVIAERGGSEEEARRQLLEEEARTLEEYLDEERDRFLIQRLRYKRIAPRVVVSWRDVEREYRRDEARYNPPPVFTLGRIRLATGRQAELITQVQERLDAGEPFLEVAETLGAAGAVWGTFEAPDGDLSKYPFGAGLQDQVGALQEVGDTVGPFELGTRTYWLHVTDIERPPSRSLFDADLQRELTARIRSMRVTEEEDRYVSTLLEKGIYDELNEMVQRLMGIAIHRYGP
ncbi:MAG: hypothetical protein GY715_20680 [Planctomycetes bacterium]|nr:hypothetical protein [Planctomycetota bacterium]